MSRKQEKSFFISGLIESKKTHPEMNFSQIISDHPFANLEFLELLERSAVVGPKTGWHPYYFVVCHDNHVKGLIPLFIKAHSYGEYIFDWAWADFYQQNGLKYYPKLLATTPFTPVIAPKLWCSSELTQNQLWREFQNNIQNVTGSSGTHFHFIGDHENSVIQDSSFFHMQTIQFHFYAQGMNDFADYLNKLKKNKRKQIKKERRKVSENQLLFERKKIQDCSPEEVEFLYQCYLSTIDKKHSYPYLNREFFIELQKSNLRFHVELARQSDETPIAMALFAHSKTHLYGRYWGTTKPEYAQIPFLHFELCYYRGMDFLFENKLQIFEAGAQGQQKLLRGFEPVHINSYHQLDHPQLHPIIKAHVESQNKELSLQTQQLRSMLPFHQ
jgi:hypothetical protein